MKKRQFIANNDQFCDIFDVETKTIYNWIEEGMPTVGKGQYNVPDCIEWRINYMIAKRLGPRLDPAQEVAKLNATKNEILKLELAEKSKELINTRSVLQMWSTILTNLRIKLLNIPKTYAQRWAGIENEYVAEDELEKLIRNSLEVLSEIKESEIKESEIKEDA